MHLSSDYRSKFQYDGIDRFYPAFLDNELDYEKFYSTNPNSDALALLKKQIPRITNDVLVVKKADEDLIRETTSYNQTASYISKSKTNKN